MNEKSYQDKYASTVDNHKTQYGFSFTVPQQNVTALGGSREQKPNIEKADTPTNRRMLQIRWHSRVAFKSTVKKGR